MCPYPRMRDARYDSRETRFQVILLSRRALYQMPRRSPINFMKSCDDARGEQRVRQAGFEVRDSMSAELPTPNFGLRITLLS